MMKNAGARGSVAQNRATASSARYGYEEGAAVGITQAHNTKKAGTLGKALARKSESGMSPAVGGFAGGPATRKTQGSAPTTQFDFQPQGRGPFKQQPQSPMSPQSVGGRDNGGGGSPHRAQMTRIESDGSPLRGRGGGGGSPQRSQMERIESNGSPLRGRGDASPQRQTQRPQSPGPRGGPQSPQTPQSPGGRGMALATRPPPQQFGLSTPRTNAKGAGKNDGKGGASPPSKGKRTPGTPGMWGDNSMTRIESETGSSPYKPKGSRSPFADISMNSPERPLPISMTMQDGNKHCQWDLMAPRIDKAHEGRIAKYPLPVAANAGKHVCASRDTDPRCASSLHGGHVVKEQEGEPAVTVVRMKNRTMAALEKEAEQGAVMNHAFTDRFVRSQAGGAMKVLMAGDGKHHWTEPGDHSENLDTSVKVAAGQVIQVDIGNKGKPPYLLQTEWPGIMPQFKTMTNFSGRLMYNKQLPKDAVTKHCLIARGCEPEEKQPDRMRRSHSMQACLQYIEHQGGEEERMTIARKELGCKRLVHPKSDCIHTIQYGDGIDVAEFKNYNKPEHPSRTTHHFTNDGGVFQMNVDNTQREEVAEKPLRKPGMFKNGFSNFTTWQNAKMDVSRYDQEEHRPLKRCLSAPPSRVDGDVITHFEKGERLGTNSGMKAPRNQPHLTCSPNGMDVSLKHFTPEEVAIQREQRLGADQKFYEKCQRMVEAHSVAREVTTGNKHKVHHLGSSAIAEVMQWN